MTARQAAARIADALAGVAFVYRDGALQVDGLPLHIDLQPGEADGLLSELNAALADKRLAIRGPNRYTHISVADSDV